MSKPQHPAWPDYNARWIPLWRALQDERERLEFEDGEYPNRIFDLGLISAAQSIIESEIDTDAPEWKAEMEHRSEKRLGLVVENVRRSAARNMAIR